MAGKGNRRDTHHHKKTPQKREKPEKIRKPHENFFNIPPEIQKLIESYIQDKTGINISDPGFLVRLRQAVIAQKAGYWKDNPTGKYGRGYDIFAYLSYHFPVYLTQSYRLFKKLEREGILPENIDLLDLGSGPGVVPLAALMMQKERNIGTLRISAIEQSSEHISAFISIVTPFADSEHSITIHKPISGNIITDSYNFPYPISVLTMQNVLAELTELSVTQRADLIMKYASCLAKGGIIIITEPAELRHATALRDLQNELINRGLFLYAPCSYPWGARCHPKECWTFWETDPIAPTKLMNAMAEGDESFRFINTDVKCSYMVLTTTPYPDNSFRLPKSSHLTRLSQLRQHIGRDISIIAVKMSENIGDTRNYVFKICDGTCKEPAFLIIPYYIKCDESKILISAEYGEILQVERVKVKWNPGKSAFNLIIQEHSRVKKT